MLGWIFRPDAGQSSRLVPSRASRRSERAAEQTRGFRSVMVNLVIEWPSTWCRSARESDGILHSSCPDSPYQNESATMMKRKSIGLPNRNRAELPQDDESQSTATTLPVLERSVERDSSVEPSPAEPEVVQPQ